MQVISANCSLTFSEGCLRIVVIAIKIWNEGNETGVGDENVFAFAFVLLRSMHNRLSAFPALPTYANPYPIHT